MINVRPVVLCGGSGTRLWPLSRSGFPKQFLSLTGDKTLFQQTADRLGALVRDQIEMRPLLVICNEDHRFLAQEQLREIGVESSLLMLEPTGRNTAPAVTLAALEAAQINEDPVLVIIPSDQIISDTSSFVISVRKAINAATQGSIVLLGVVPERPETGYGYIKVAPTSSDVLPLAIERFVEKPDAKSAQEYLNEGGYFWNAGMFVVKASVWLDTLKQFRPDILESTQNAWSNRTHDSNFVRPDKELFTKVPSESVDYAVLERCPGQRPISMVPLSAGWSDLGAWDAVWDVQQSDDNGNVFNGDIISTKSRGNLAYSTSRLVGLVGVDNLVVVETPDAVLVANKSRCQDVKNIVETLHAAKREEPALHRKVQRPWGWYDSIDHGQRFKVKRIQVKPGATLSLQKHHYRAEHWIVVKGVAEITCGNKTFRLHEDQSTYIPQGEIHRLGNPGNAPLEIIEVQTGNYLEEDDIVRFEDEYGRVRT